MLHKIILNVFTLLCHIKFFKVLFVHICRCLCLMDRLFPKIYPYWGDTCIKCLNFGVFFGFRKITDGSTGTFRKILNEGHNIM